jgi:hypothetical protein
MVLAHSLAALVVWWLACWPLVPKIAGLNLAEATGFFRRKNPQYAFLRRGSKTHVADLRHVKRPLQFTWKLEPQEKLTGHFSPIIPSFTDRGLSCRLTWNASGDDGRN